MTVQITSLTPVLSGAPGEVLVGRVRLDNYGEYPATVVLRVVGLGADGQSQSVGPVPSGSSTETDITITVPDSLGAGRHDVAIEALSDLPGDRPALTRITVAVESMRGVRLLTSPRTVRARRRGKFRVDVANQQPEPVEVSLSATSPKARVKLVPERLIVAPGQYARVRGRVIGPRRISGEPLHHLVTLTARGRSATTSTNFAYIQRGLVSWRLRSAAMAAAVVAVWAIGVLVTLVWWGNREDSSAPSSDSSGIVLDNEFLNTGVGGSGGASGGADNGGPTGPRIPIATVATGVVTVPGGDASGVQVALAPIDLGAPSPNNATTAGAAGRSPAVSKVWSVRHAQRVSSLSALRQSESVASSVTDGAGVWLFSEIPIRQSYELVFSKPGFDTQSFVITPDQDGSRVELDIEMIAATGSVSGRVVGPSGAIGGVEILVTDGTLTFETRSATAASTTAGVGEFQLDGLSTPGVYTLSASLRGFGTEVLQLRLGPGGSASPIVTMRPGVGSISGRVVIDNQPAGGVTVVATSGDESITTTSLTEGDVGSFSIPGLNIPADYTVTATLPGFIPQTRRVQLAGNATDVDFEMVATTARISGRVLSSTGEPLVGADVRISVDDVGFRTSTAASPTPGNFDVKDLPTGTYLVRIDRFDHRPFAQQVTLTAGQALDLGEITLDFALRAPLAATGSLSVRVFNSAGAPLDEARVRIERLNTQPGELDVSRVAPPEGQPVSSQTDFSFQNLPVGTYRLTVERRIHQTVTRRVSIGLGPRTEDISMLRLGQASGSIEDRTRNDVQLRGYELVLSRLTPSGTVASSQTVVVPEGALPVEGQLVWRSAVDSLVSGLYLIEVTQAPRGYFISEDQILDPTVPGTNKAMRFVVPEDSEDAVVVPPISAQPYPTIGGRLFRPTSGASGDLREFTTAEVAALVAPDGARLVCADGATTSALLLPGPDDLTAVQPFPGFTLPDNGEHFLFTPFQIADDGLDGLCELEIEADGFLDSIVVLTSPIQPAAGVAPSSRTVNVPMWRDLDALQGEVFWVDLGTSTPIPISGVNVQTSLDTITGYQAGQFDTFQNTAPTPATGSPFDTSDDDGFWEIAGHIAGTSVYTFTDAEAVATDGASRQFGASTVTVLVNGDGSRNVTAGLNTEVVPPALPDGRWRVRLTDPIAGDLEGSVTILTTKAAPDFAGVTLTVTDPGSNVLAPPPLTGTGPTRTFSVNPAAAGTWRVDFGAPDEHVLFDGSAASVTGLVEPSRTNDSFDTTFVELGAVNLSVNYQRTPTNPNDAGVAALPRAAATYVLDTAGQPSITGSANQTSPTLDEIRIAELVVDADNPTGQARPYTLGIAAPGFDVNLSTLVVTRSSAAINLPTPTEFGVLAGDELSAAITIGEYGRLEGLAVGQFFPGDPVDPDNNAVTTPLPFGQTVEGGELVVVAQRVQNPDGSAVAEGPARTQGVQVIASPYRPGGFAVVGPAGLYSLTVTHPAFETVPLSVPTPDSDPLYRITNSVVNELADPWLLDIQKGTLDLSVVASASFVSPILGADVTLLRNNVLVSAGATDALGALSLNNLVPGTYQLQIRSFKPIADPAPDPALPREDAAFPMIATITIPTGTTPEARTVKVTAVLPLLQASITGTVTAVNSDDASAQSVAIPTGLQITREFVPPALIVDPLTGAAVLNQATDADVVPAPTLTAPVTVEAGGLSGTFGFTPVAGGTHRLTIPEPAGYVVNSVSVGGTALTPTAGIDEVIVEVPVDDFDFVTPTAVAIVYRALLVELTVELTYLAGSFTDENRVVTLLSPGGVAQAGGFVERVSTNPAQPFTDVFRFTGLLPRTEAYRLQIDDPLHSPDSVDIIVAAGTTQQSREIAMLPDAARIIGSAQQQDTPGGTSTALQCPPVTDPPTPEGGCGAVRIEVFEGVPGVSRGTYAYTGDGSYEFIVSNAGTYRVEISRPGYTTTVSSNVTVTRGRQQVVDPITLLRRATVTVNASAGTAVADAVAVAAVSGAPAAPTVTKTGDVWTVLLDPGFEYRLTATKPDHYSQTLPALTVDPYLATIGGTPTFATVIAPRTVTVNVTGPAEAVNATVALSVGGVTSTRVAPVTGPFVFTSLDEAEGSINPLPLAGEGTVTISAAGFRSQTVEVATNDLATPSQTISVTLQPEVTSVSGSITGFSEGISVTATRVGGGGTASATTTAGGAFTLTLEVPSTTYAPGTWTLTAAEFGVGSLVDKGFEITATAPAGATLAIGAVAPTPRSVAVTFTVTNAPDGVAKVQLGAVTQNTVAGSTVFQVPETATGAALDYIVTAPARMTQTGSVTLSSLAVSESVTLVTSPVLSGSLTGTTGASTVVLRSTCASATNLASASIAADVYTFPASTIAVAGEYCIVGRKNSSAADVTLGITVGDDGTVTPADLSLNLG